MPKIKEIDRVILSKYVLFFSPFQSLSVWLSSLLLSVVITGCWLLTTVLRTQFFCSQAKTSMDKILRLNLQRKEYRKEGLEEAVDEVQRVLLELILM